MAAPRSISLLRLLLGACVLGVGFGTALYWIRASRDDERLEAVMRQQDPRNVDLRQRQSVDLTAPPPAALHGIPPYPNAVPRKVAEKVRGQGNQMAIAWFSTDDSVEQVITFYEHAFANQGHIFASHRYNARSGYAGWMQPDHRSPYADAGLELLDGVMHLVSVMREGHQTAVLLSATRPLKLLGEGANLPPGVTLPPWADPPQVFDLGEGALSQTTLFSEIKGHGLEEVDAWMRTNLKQHGWKLADHASAAARTSIDFRREKEHLSVVLTPTKEKVSLMLQYANQPQSLNEGL